MPVFIRANHGDLRLTLNQRRRGGGHPNCGGAPRGEPHRHNDDRQPRCIRYRHTLMCRRADDDTAPLIPGGGR